MAKNKGGRPGKMLPETIHKLEEAFSMGCTIVEACLHADIGSSTYYNWIGDNPELLERFEQLKNRPFLKARTTIIESLDQPEYAFKYMERKKKDEFSIRTENINENTNIEVKKTIEDKRDKDEE